MNRQVWGLAALLVVWQVIQPAFAKDVDSELVSRMLREADNAISSGRFDDAVVKCQAGLNVLGDAYVDDAVEDDTGQKLIAADILLRQGKVENASSMYCRMLEERFQQFKKKRLKN